MVIMALLCTDEKKPTEINQWAINNFELNKKEPKLLYVPTNLSLIKLD